MRLPAIVDAPLEAAARVGWHGLAVRSVIGVAAVGCWAVAAAVGEANLPMTLLVALTGLVSVTRPDSGAPLALIAVLGLLWIVEVRPLSVGWSLALAISVLLVHTAAARAAAMGDGAAIGADVARRWLAQTTVVAGATVAVWAFVGLLDRATPAGGVALSAVAFAATAVFAVAVVSADRSDVDE
jgi:hypothetical protein